MNNTINEGNSMSNKEIVLKLKREYEGEFRRDFRIVSNTDYYFLEVGYVDDEGEEQFRPVKCPYRDGSQCGDWCANFNYFIWNKVRVINLKCSNACYFIPIEARNKI